MGDERAGFASSADCWDFYLHMWITTRFVHDSDHPAITQELPTAPKVSRLHTVAAGNLHRRRRDRAESLGHGRRLVDTLLFQYSDGG